MRRSLVKTAVCGAGPVGLHVTVLSGLLCELNSVLFPQSLLVIPALSKVHSAIPDSCRGMERKKRKKKKNSLPSFSDIVTQRYNIQKILAA